MNEDFENPEQLLAKYGKSFNFAAFFLNKTQKKQAQIVYAFCRYIDDVVDEIEDKAIAKALIESVKQAIFYKKSNNVIVDNMLTLMDELKISPVVVNQLVDGVAFDLEHQRIHNQAELLRYSYGVAGTVGLLMCYVFKIKNSTALKYAVDLGIAMQLTNIARDVQEDALKQRVYLPQNWFDKPITPKDILQTTHRQTLFSVIQKILELSKVYYNSACEAMPYLPFRVRFCVLTAAKVYGAIGHKISEHDANSYFQQKRIHTTFFEKIKICLGVLFSADLWHTKKSTEAHAMELHIEIEDLISDV